jgi:L-rhamnose mutarotase
MTFADAGPGEAVLFIYRLKPGMGEEYDRMHAAVWPEILALLDEAGMYDYRIWRHEEVVVSQFRTRQGFRHARAVTAASEAQARWTAAMSHIFDVIAGKDGDPLWLRPVFTHKLLPEPGEGQ